MAKYRKKPVVIEAVQWFAFDPEAQGIAKQVEFWADRFGPSDRLCEICGRYVATYGWVDTLEGGHIVCPGDYIIKGIKGEFYPCKPDIFRATYEKVIEEV